MYKITESTKKLLKLNKRIKAVCGGTSASKTISILMIIIDWCQTNKNKKFDVMSESYPHLEDGAIKDFREIMLDRGYWDDAKWNGTKHTYTFETQTVLKFISIDKLGKAHGPRRDGLFVNEANNIPFDVYEQLEVRTKETVWLDWNPSNEFWYYQYIEGKIDHDFITLTYLDCIDALDQNIIDSIESRKDRKGWWQVYGLGKLGEVEGKIYKKWNIIEDIPHEAKLVRRGLDFGYTNDPTAMLDIYSYNGGYILDEQLYQKGMRNSQIADFINNLETPGIMTVADSSEPKSIDEIRTHGVNIIGAKKGPGSVNAGIDFVQDQQISVTKRSINLIKEYRNYLFITDKNGVVTNVPEDIDNHLMDALRYGLESFRKKEKSIKEAQEDYLKQLQRMS